MLQHGSYGQTALAGRQERAYSNEVEPTPAAFLPSACLRAENVRDRLVEILRSLDHLRERAYGPQPAQPGSSTGAPAPMGAVHLMATIQEQQVALLGSIDSVLRELDALA